MRQLLVRSQARSVVVDAPRRTWALSHLPSLVDRDLFGDRSMGRGRYVRDLRGIVPRLRARPAARFGTVLGGVPPQVACGISGWEGLGTPGWVSGAGG